MKKSLLILEDKFSQKDRLINLGDRATWYGLHKLIEKNSNYRILAGEVKPFPYINIKIFKDNSSYSDIEKVFDKWFQKVVNFSHKRAKSEACLVNFLDNSFLFNNFLFGMLEEKFRDKFSRGIIETLKPYLFRHYYARELINQIKEADIVYGFGEFLADHVKFYLPMVMFEVYLAKRLGKKVVTINKSISLKDPLAFKIVSYVYKMVDMHTIREPISKKELLRMGCKENRILVLPDFAFAADILPKKDIEYTIGKEGIKKGDVGLIIRGDMPVDYEKWLLVINYIQRIHKRRVFFIFTCKSHDKKVFKKLSSMCILHKFSKYYDFPAVINLLKNFDFVITDRYHGVIFAILANTPIIAIHSTMHKTEGLFMLFNYPIKVAKRGDSGSIIKNIEFVIKNKKKILRLLSKEAPRLIKRVNEDTKTLLNGSMIK